MCSVAWLDAGSPLRRVGPLLLSNPSAGCDSPCPSVVDASRSGPCRCETLGVAVAPHVRWRAASSRCQSVHPGNRALPKFCPWGRTSCPNVHNASAREGPQCECKRGSAIRVQCRRPHSKCGAGSTTRVQQCWRPQPECSSAGSTIRVQECLYGLAMRSLKRKEREERNKKRRRGKKEQREREREREVLRAGRERPSGRVEKGPKRGWRKAPERAEKAPPGGWRQAPRKEKRSCPRGNKRRSRILEE